MAAKIGNEPSMGVRRVYVFYPTEGATSVSGPDANGVMLSYDPLTPPNVHLNGSKLVAGHDYVATTGTSITGIAPMHAGDVVVIEVFGTWSPADAYAKIEADARFLQKTGGELSGPLVAVNGLIAKAAHNGDHAHFWLADHEGKFRGRVNWNGNDTLLEAFTLDGNGNIIASTTLAIHPNGTLTFNGNTVWHAGNFDYWAALPPGVLIPLWDHIPGIYWPPMDKGYRYVVLTAGQAGPGQYNEGILTNETVSGSAPLITATAVINLPASPIHGQTIHLINTERRFIRAGWSGSTQDDAMQTHSHPYTVPSGMGGAAGGATQFYWSVTTSNTANNNGRTDNETRPRNIGATYFMRIL